MGFWGFGVETDFWGTKWYHMDLEFELQQCKNHKEWKGRKIKPSSEQAWTWKTCKHTIQQAYNRWNKDLLDSKHEIQNLASTFEFSKNEANQAVASLAIRNVFDLRSVTYCSPKTPKPLSRYFKIIPNRIIFMEKVTRGPIYKYFKSIDRYANGV